MINFNDYQESAGQFADYKDPAYPFMALAEETGEVVAHVSKWMRKRGKVDWLEPFDLETRNKLADELGDVLWMIAECADQIGYDLSVIAEMNISKLLSRHGYRKGKLPLIEVEETL